MAWFLDWLGVAVGVVGTTYCFVQLVRGVPVEPSWMWGVMAFYLWADHGLTRLARAQVK